MKELLEQYGWWMYHSCTCGGSLKQKFKHPSKPGMEIHLRPNRNQWWLLINKRNADQGNGQTLKDKLDAI